MFTSKFPIAVALNKRPRPPGSRGSEVAYVTLRLVFGLYNALKFKGEVRVSKVWTHAYPTICRSHRTTADMFFLPRVRRWYPHLCRDYSLHIGIDDSLAGGVGSDNPKRTCMCPNERLDTATTFLRFITGRDVFEWRTHTAMLLMSYLRVSQGEGCGVDTSKALAAPD